MNSLKIILVILGIALFHAIGVCCSWQISTVDTVTTNEQYGDTSLKLDQLGNPHIAYTDHHTSSLGYLKYASWSGSQWIIQQVNTSGNISANPSLALDQTNNPHISCWKAYVATGLYYVYQNSGSWIITEIGDNGNDCSIALDSYNNPYISYMCVDPSLTPSLYCNYNNGFYWNVFVVDNEADCGVSSSIAIDNNNKPHISYRTTYPTRYLKYAYYNGSDWIISVVDPEYDIGYYSSIALDSNNNPHIAYRSASNPSLKYAYYNGSEWLISIVDNNNNSGFYASLALDSNNNPHIAYIDNYQHKLKYASNLGSGWQISFIDNDSNYKYWSSLALDDDNTAHISYLSTDYPLKIKYAVQVIESSIKLKSLDSIPGDKKIVVHWQISDGNLEDVLGLNLLRSDSKNQKRSQLEKLNQSLITPSGNSEFIDSKVKNGSKYQYYLQAVYSDGTTEILGNTSCRALAHSSLVIESICPNPAKQFTECRIIAPNTYTSVTVELFDVAGHLVKKSQAFSDGEGIVLQTFDLSDISAGVYLIHASCKDASATKRIVVIH